MPPHDMFWTEARIARLRERIARNESRREIAAALGCTTNAVIGKAHRLGLSKRMWRDDSDIGRRRRLDRRNQLAKLRRARGAPMNEASKPTPKPPRRRRVFGPRVPKAFPGRPVEIWQLCDGHCRWPLWDDHSPVKLYCGDERVIGCAYCPTHRNAANGRVNR